MALHWRSPDVKPGNRGSRGSGAVLLSVIVAVICVLVAGLGVQFLARILS
jgi:hypothetical protein